MTIKKRKLGRSGLEVAPLALGGNVFGWTVDEPTGFDILDAFVDAGFNLVDTADVYSNWGKGNSGGESEALIGKWFAKSGKRDKVVIATKVGNEMAPGKQGLRRDYIVSAAEDSLRRLQTDYIDLYQSHIDDENAPLEETLAAYGELIAQGKVRAIGASNYSAPRLAEALQVSAEHGLPRYETLQPPYNLVQRAQYEADLEAVCLNSDLGVIPYSGLAGGFLTGKYRSEADWGKSPRGGGLKHLMDQHGTRVLAALDKVSGDYHATPAQVALAWLMARPSITAPIASATSVSQLGEIIQAASLQLDTAAIAYLDRQSVT